jgi:hypothetical protein
MSINRREHAGLAALLSLFAVVAVVFASLLVISVLDVADVGPNFRTGVAGPDSYLIRNARIDTVVSAILFVAAMGSTMAAAVVRPGRGQHIVTAVVCVALLPLGVADFLALAVAF